MGSLIKLFKYIFLIGLLIYSTLVSVDGQVITRVLSPDDQFENYIPWYNSITEPPVFTLPKVDVDSVLAQDQLTARIISRIGIKQDVNITTNDGAITQMGNFSIWSLILESEYAKSLSIRFNNTFLPEDAIMFIYNQDTRFIVGPISSNDFINGIFRSDYISGNKAEVTIFFPNLTEPIINIGSYDHGIVEFSHLTNSFGKSLECNINVACDEGNGWGCQINSVCRIITVDENGTGSCTGTLVNNDCCDLSAFILTANHCVNENFIDDYLFQFNWQTPECENGVNAPTKWVTYMGAELRANWVNTDFSLLELFQDITPIDGISFAGWDRRDNIPDEVTIIHHPRGDVKKISFTDNPLLENEEITGTTVTLSPEHSIRVVFNEINSNSFGIIERGSSGGPWYDDDRRITGYTSVGQATNNCEIERNYWAGRFFNSWEGNGTNDTRLRNWLGAAINPNTMDCMEHPFIDGPDILCTSPEEFTLINHMPCAKNIIWAVEPEHLFDSPTNGVGVTATLSGKFNVRGPATLTYTLTSVGCNDAIIEESFWVGRPLALTTYPDPTICLGQFEEIFIPESPGATHYHIQTNSTGLWLSTNNPTPNNPFIVIGTQLGFHPVYLTVTNQCGQATAVIYVEVVGCDGGGFEYRQVTPVSKESKISIDLFPNPSKDLINIKCRGLNSDAKVYIEVLSPEGRVILNFFNKGHTHQLYIGELPSGVYFLKIEIEGKIHHKKMIKL